MHTIVWTNMCLALLWWRLCYAIARLARSRDDHHHTVRAVRARERVRAFCSSHVRRVFCAHRAGFRAIATTLVSADTSNDLVHIFLCSIRRRERARDHVFRKSIRCWERNTRVTFSRCRCLYGVAVWFCCTGTQINHRYSLLPVVRIDFMDVWSVLRACMCWNGRHLYVLIACIYAGIDIWVEILLVHITDSYIQM